MVEGRSGLLNLPDSLDVNSTLQAVEALGVRVSREGGRVWLDSPGLTGWTEPRAAIDCGNSGTTARLLLGLLAGSGLDVRLTGDESLSQRPMARVAAPLRRMGALIEQSGDGLPVHIKSGRLEGIHYELPVASAQLKSAVLFAGLQAKGETRVREPLPSRDHTERLLGLNSEVVAFSSAAGAGVVREWIVSERDLPRQAWSDISLPADPSTAAFFVAALLLMDEGELLLPGLLVNPFRRDYLDELLEWGGLVELEEIPGEGFCGPTFCGLEGCNPGEQCPIAEPVANLRVRAGYPLSARPVSGRRLPRLIDEIPALAVAAMRSDTPFEVSDAAELRVKESDRIQGLVELLRAFGGTVTEKADGFRLEAPETIRAARYDARGDHRLAMAACVLALAADDESEILETGSVAVSHPGFHEDLRRLHV
jgi:3-phosphoshikimate 1-carboxyvinyltransferase